MGLSGDQAGVLLFAPVYQSSWAHDTVESRRRNIRGFIAQEVLFSKLFGTTSQRAADAIESPYDLDVYDDTKGAGGTLLFAQHVHDGDVDSVHIQADLPTYDESFDVGGRAWRLVLRSTGAEYLSISAHSWNAAAV